MGVVEINKKVFILVIIFMVIGMNSIALGDKVESEVKKDILNDRVYINDKITVDIEIDQVREIVYINDTKFDFKGSFQRIHSEDLTNDGSQELIITSKEGGTSSYLNYYVFRVENDRNIKLSFERNNIYKGVLIVRDNKIIERTPLYSKNDANANSDKYLESTYIYDGEDFILDKKSAESNSDVKLFSLRSRKYYENPTRKEIEAKIEKVALEKGIPPVILKSIAYTESDFTQFKDGEPLLSFDGVSYGVMQVTPHIHTEYDDEKLKYDMDYNINAGAEILLDKWGYALRDNPIIPKIGNYDPRILENWYFAIWAYNGWSESNNPNMIPYHHGSWVQYKAYQEKVLDYAYMLYDVEIGGIDHRELPVEGKPNPNYRFDTPTPYTQVSFNTHEKGDILINDTPYGLNIRNYDGEKIAVSSPNEALIYLEGPIFLNDYLRYRVKTIGKDGDSIEGWVAINWTKSAKDCDFNKDGIVSILDIEILKKMIGDRENQFDINYDYNVDDYDLEIVKKAYNMEQDWDIWSTKRDIAPDKQWDIDFNYDVLADALNSGDIYITDEYGEMIDVVFKNTKKDIIRVIPLDNYNRGEYYLYITNQVKSVNGKKLKKGIKIKFIVE